jgi:dipeptidyl aminopeptidase/acylaminoacyl peptidase
MIARTLIAAAALAAISATPAAAQSGETRLSLDAFMRLETVMDLALSPDGKTVAYVVAVPDSAADRHRSALRIVAVDGVTPLSLGDSTDDDQPRWSPDGRLLAYRSRGSRGPVVRIIDRAGRQRQVVAPSSGAVRALAWSPRGDELALVVDDPVAETPSSAVRPPPPAQRSHVWIARVDTGEMRRLTSGPFLVDDLDWSPDASRIVLSRRPHATTISFILETDLAVVSVADGRIRPLVERPGLDDMPRWSPDGRWIAFVTHDGRTNWIGDTEVAVVPAAGGTPRMLRSLGERVLPGEAVLSWRADSRAVYYAVPSGTGTQLLEMPLDGGDTRVLADCRALACWSFAVSADARRMAFIGSDARTPWEVFVSPTSRFTPRRLTTSNAGLDQLALAALEVVRWRDEAGLELEGLLMTPTTGAPPYPLLTWLHGGPAWQFTNAFTPHGMLPTPPSEQLYGIQLLAARGYAVFMPNIRGSTGQGHDFRMANIGDWGGGDLRDVLSGIDVLVRRGVVDSTRLGVMGSSYGGTLTALAIARSGRFRAAEVGAGIVDPVGMYLGTDIPPFIAAYFGGAPWQEPNRYLEHSAIASAARIGTPTLIQHGDADRRVPLAQGEALHRALEERGVPTELRVYRGQGHRFTSLAAERDYLEQLIAWFDRWLASPDD